jgi:D-alanyl-D-alanine carboxypeptidase
MTLKSSMNESDNEMAALLKENITAMKGDTAGRRLGVRIARDFGSRGAGLTSSRKFGRR